MPPSPTERLLAEFTRLPVTRNLLAQVKLGAHVKAGGLWGASAGLLLAVLQQHRKGSMLVLTADDVDSLQLQLDLQAFGVAAHVLPREEVGDDGEPDPTTRSERQRALQRHRTDKLPLLAGRTAPRPPASRRSRAAS